MNFTGLSEACFRMWKSVRGSNRSLVTVCVLGPPGVGKTSAGRHLAEMMTKHVQARSPGAPPAVCEALDLSSMLPEDLMGLPDTKGIDPETGKRVTKYIPQSWLAPLCEEGAYGVLILDDLPAASAQVQVACRQVSLERRIHKDKLSDGIFIIVTGNRREDKSAASTLPAHFRNSVVLLSFEPDFSGWESWYMAQGYDSDIPAFLHWRKENFSRLPKDADGQGAFATPRTWSMLGSLTSSLENSEVNDVAAGLVGTGVSIEYAAFRLLRRELVSPEEVLKNPEKALPNLNILDSPDKMVAMVTGLGEVAARKVTGKNKMEDRLHSYLRAIAYVTSKKGGREYVSVSLSTFTSTGGQMKQLLTAARSGRSDPLIKGLINYLSKALSD